MPTIGPEIPPRAGVADGGTAPLLETARLLLRHLASADVTAITSLAGDWQVARYTARIPHPFEAEHAWGLLDMADKGWRSGKTFIFALERLGVPGLIGCVELRRQQAAARRGELGYWVGRLHWGQGYASEAVAGVVAYAREHLGIDHFSAEVMAENLASARVLERLGFAFVTDAVGDCGRCQGRATQHYELCHG